MNFSGRIKSSRFSHGMYGHGYRCQGGYGGEVYEVNNLSEILTAAAAPGPKRIHIATAGEYALAEDLDLNVSYTDFVNTSGGNVVFTGAGIRIGSNVTHLYMSEIEVRRTNAVAPETAENNGDPIHINPGCDAIYFYKCAFYEGIDDSSIRSGGVTFHLCHFGPNWDDHEEAMHAYGPFTTDQSTGATLLYPLIHSLDYRSPLIQKGYGLVYGFIVYNCAAGPAVSVGAYAEYMYGWVISGPSTTTTYLRSEADGADIYVRNCLADGFRNSETDPDREALKSDTWDRIVNRDTTQPKFPMPEPMSVADTYTYVMANVGPTHKSATLQAYLDQVGAGTGAILRA